MQPGAWRIALDLFLIGMFGGFYIVPLYALIQTRCPPSHRSRVIAANNILNALFMVVAAGLAVVTLNAGMTIPQVLLLTGALNAAVALYIYVLVPEFLLRFVDWMLVHSIYRLKTSGIENIPEEGPALLICNHQSLADALVITAACRRPIRFVMYYAIFNVPVLRFIFRSMKAIPIAGSKESPELLDRAYDEIAAALEDGQLVCIFPEGGLTHDGEIGPFPSRHVANPGAHAGACDPDLPLGPVEEHFRAQQAGVDSLCAAVSDCASECGRSGGSRRSDPRCDTHRRDGAAGREKVESAASPLDTGLWACRRRFVNPLWRCRPRLWRQRRK